MKKNKKAILGLAIAMIFCLAIMQGVSQKNVQNQNMNLQQLGAGCSWVSGETEGGCSSVMNYLSNGCLTVSCGMAGYGIASIYGLVPNPVTAGYWVTTGIIFC